MVQQLKSRADLDEAVKQAAGKLIVIDFYATWCVPCKMIAPELEKIAEDLKDKLVVVKIDVDECNEIVDEYGVTSMPTFVFLKNGSKIDSFAGANKQKLKEAIEKHL